MDYDRTVDSNTVSLQGYSDGVTRTVNDLASTAIFEEANTDSAIGARFDSNGGSYQITNHFTGFIYNIAYYGGVVQNESTMNGYVTQSSSCTGTCIICPTTTTTCLWNCLPSEYFDDTAGMCLNCNPSCPGTHPNAWDGCVRA